MDHASKACELSSQSADAWSTRAFVLFLNGDPADAEAAACKAVDLEPSDSRHAIRLSYVSWGEARLRAARRALTLCPGLAGTPPGRAPTPSRRHPWLRRLAAADRTDAQSDRTPRRLGSDARLLRDRVHLTPRSQVAP